MRPRLGFPQRAKIIESYPDGNDEVRRVENEADAMAKTIASAIFVWLSVYPSLV